VLSMQRAIAMLGLEGLEQAARSLKQWPGPLNEHNANELRKGMARVQRVAEIAQQLRPPGYSGEVIFIICLMQNLGQLLLEYHRPEDAQQIRHLMQAPEPTEDNPNPLGMTAEVAAHAVMGVDIETLGAAVAGYWALGPELLHMARRQAPDAPVRHADSDAEIIRLTCSLASELVDALKLPLKRRQAGIELATKRYARALSLSLREVQEALNPNAAPRPDGELAAPFHEGPVRPSALRDKAVAPDSKLPAQDR
ncbi:MAG TPA: HDOD domain-containing protein, partial [Burkholderiaceae bacterium]